MKYKKLELQTKSFSGCNVNQGLTLVVLSRVGEQNRVIQSSQGELSPINCFFNLDWLNNCIVTLVYLLFIWRLARITRYVRFNICSLNNLARNLKLRSMGLFIWVIFFLRFFFIFYFCCCFFHFYLFDITSRIF